jgi:hypothetical protein
MPGDCLNVTPVVKSAGLGDMHGAVLHSYVHDFYVMGKNKEVNNVS